MDSSNKRLYAALAAEFLGMLLFSLYGGSANDSAAAFGNGLSLMILIYATCNVSGGHLNPAVTLATMISGHMPARRGGLYMAAQFAGGIIGGWGGGWEGGWVGGSLSSSGGRGGGTRAEIFVRRLPFQLSLQAGVLFQVALIPSASLGMGNAGPGCFTHVSEQAGSPAAPMCAPSATANSSPS